MLIDSCSLAASSLDQLSDNHKKLISDLPNQALVQGILEEKMPFQILQIGSKPDYVFIRAKNTATFLAGEPSQAQLNDLIHQLSRFKKTTLICLPSLQQNFKNHGYTVQSRVAFHVADLFKNSTDLAVVPALEGYRIQKIDTVDLFKQCLWFKNIAMLWGGPEEFINNSFGFVLLNAQNKVVAEAHGAWIGNGLCEIGVITHPDFRGQGFSPILTRQMLQECKIRNLTPVWSCDCKNIASRKVAAKAGFQERYQYAWLIKKQA